MGLCFCDIIISAYVPCLQSWRLLVVDSCGRAHGGWRSGSRCLPYLHWAAPPWTWKTRGEQCPGQIWDRNYDLILKKKQVLAWKLKSISTIKNIWVYLQWIVAWSMYVNGKFYSHLFIYTWIFYEAFKVSFFKKSIRLQVSGFIFQGLFYISNLTKIIYQLYKKYILFSIIII